jgi:hypothetical protein
MDMAINDMKRTLVSRALTPLEADILLNNVAAGTLKNRELELLREGKWLSIFEYNEMCSYFLILERNGRRNLH